MNSKSRRLSRGPTDSASKLKLDSISKILKLDSARIRKHKKRQVSKVALAELLKNSPSTTRVEPPNFKDFLANQENVSIFKEFLQSQFCQENIDFYLACDKYSKLSVENVGPEMVKFMATQIYNDFLGKDAKTPINVSNSQSDFIRSNLKNPQPDLFSEVQSEVYELMRTDCYPRFCKTWRLDRKLAEQILARTVKQHGEQSASINPPQMISFVTGYSSPSIRLDNSQLSFASSTLSHRSVTRSDRSTSSQRPACIQQCCSAHDCTRASILTKRKLEVDSTSEMAGLDLKRIHRMPNLKPLPPTPPPARPLAPKPHNIVHNTEDKRQLPFVGKVFNV